MTCSAITQAKRLVRPKPWAVMALCLTVLIALVFASGCAPHLQNASGASGSAEDSGPFSIILLPDTQFYSREFPETYLAQTKWIRDSAGKLNTKFVIHLGDIVDHAPLEAEWKVADEAHKILDGSVPYSVLPGNHDMDPGRGLDLYNRYFGPDRFAGKPWYGGSISPSNNAASYCRFRAGGQQWMVLSLGYDPPEADFAWARKVAAAHPGDNIIVAAHAYLLRNGQKGPQGRVIWDQLVSMVPNVRLVVAGHVAGVAHNVVDNKSGGKVVEILCDYQGMPDGGSGWLQVLGIDPGTGKMTVKAYSPLLNIYNEEPAHSYTLDFDI